MIKLILFAVIGLVIGIGGGSAVSVMQAKKAFAADVALKAKLVADSLAHAEEEGATSVAHAADSAAHDSLGSDSTTDHAPAANAHDAGAAPASGNHKTVARATKTPAGAAEAHGASSSPATAYGRATRTVEATGGTPVKGALAKPPALPTKPLPEVAEAPGMAKVAKIFAAMPPKDAAKVLEQLDDLEVQGVISVLSEKQAAAILQNFPAPRAAAISKGVLRAAISRKP